MSFAYETININVSSSAVNQSASSFNTNLAKALPLNKGRWSVAVTAFSGWNTNFNISAALNNNTFTYYNGSTTKTVTLGNGLYQISDIISAVSTAVTNNGDTPSNIILSIYQPAITTAWTLANGYTVTIPAGFGNIIGWTAQTVSTQGITIGNTQSNVTDSINNFLVHCNFLDAGASIVNGNSSDVIFTYPISAAPIGSIISLTPQFPIFYPTSSLNLNSININITDQNNNPVNFNSGTSFQNNGTSIQFTFVKRSD
jgi:hypothetical protein